MIPNNEFAVIVAGQVIASQFELIDAAGLATADLGATTGPPITSGLTLHHQDPNFTDSSLTWTTARNVADVTEAVALVGPHAATGTADVRLTMKGETSSDTADATLAAKTSAGPTASLTIRGSAGSSTADLVGDALTLSAAGTVNSDATLKANRDVYLSPGTAGRLKMGAAGRTAYLPISFTSFSLTANQALVAAMTTLGGLTTVVAVKTGDVLDISTSVNVQRTVVGVGSAFLEIRAAGTVLATTLTNLTTLLDNAQQSIRAFYTATADGNVTVETRGQANLVPAYQSTTFGLMNIAHYAIR